MPVERTVTGVESTALAAITIRASDNARRAVCGLLTPGRWHSSPTGKLEALPEWIRMEAAAARALAQWARHQDRDLHIWVASGPWFVRVVKWARTGGGGAERRRVLGRYLDVEAAALVAEAVRAGRLQALLKPHHAGVEAAIVLADAHFRAGVDLANVLAGGDSDAGDLARIQRTRTRSEATPAPEPGVLRVTSDASFSVRNDIVRGAWAIVRADGTWETGSLLDGVVNSYLAELQAAVEALERSPGDGVLELCSDNSAVIRNVQAIADGTAPTAGPVEVENELLVRAAAVCAGRDVRTRWVPGHAGVAENWLADALAGAFVLGAEAVPASPVVEAAPARSEPVAVPAGRRRGRRGGRRRADNPG